MPTTTHFVTVINAPAAEAYRAEIGRRALPSSRVPGCYESESLCAAQRALRAEGYQDAELVHTLKGWSLRHGSGLDNRGLIAPGLPTFSAAVTAAGQWVGDNPKRYAWVRLASLAEVDDADLREAILARGFQW